MHIHQVLNSILTQEFLCSKEYCDDFPIICESFYVREVLIIFI